MKKKGLIVTITRDNSLLKSISQKYKWKVREERMVFSVRPKNVKKILEVFSGENVEATVIGEFTGSKKLELFFKGNQVCDIDMEFLYEGTPKITKEAVWEEPSIKIPVIPLQSRAICRHLYLDVSDMQPIVGSCMQQVA